MATDLDAAQDDVEEDQDGLIKNIVQDGADMDVAQNDDGVAVTLSQNDEDVDMNVILDDMAGQTDDGWKHANRPPHGPDTSPIHDANDDFNAGYRQSDNSDDDARTYSNADSPSPLGN